MGAPGALMLMIPACGSATPFADPAEPIVDVPPALYDAYSEAAQARFSLASCRAPEQRQAIGGLDSARARVEQALGATYARPVLEKVRLDTGRQFLAAQVEQCAGAAGIERFRRAITALERQTARAN